MNKIFPSIYIIVMAVLLVSCTSKDSLYSEKFWVKTSTANTYSRASVLSKEISSFKFMDEVLGRENKPASNIPEDWLEIKLGPKSYGYIERGKLADKTIMDKLKLLTAGVEGKQVQAKGIIDKKSFFRIGPSRDAAVIEFLRKSQNADVFGRFVTMRKVKGDEKKDVWYKVRLESGQVGYVYTGNFSFTPPGSIGRYTESRRAVSWQLLRTRDNGETNMAGDEYITTYRSTTFDIGADFDRVEVYTYDPKSGQYATAFARSKLKGILPVNVIAADGSNKIFQIRQLIEGKNDKLLVQEYSFPPPIKLVREYEEETTPAPH